MYRILEDFLETYKKLLYKYKFLYFYLTYTPNLRLFQTNCNKLRENIFVFNLSFQ